VDLRIEGRPVLLDLTQDVLEHLKRHQAGIGRRLDDVIGGKVSTWTGRATEIASADDIDPVSINFRRFSFHDLPHLLNAVGGRALPDGLYNLGTVYIPTRPIEGIIHSELIEANDQGWAGVFPWTGGSVRVLGQRG
jgi:hypothetical protein